MRPVRPALDAFVQTLRSAGFRADLDPAALSFETVGVWVQPRTRTQHRLDGGGTVICWVYLICANTETPTALNLLDDALAGLLELVALSDTDDGVDLAVALALPSAPSNPLPAYRVAVDIEL